MGDMSALDWFLDNWFTLLNATGIVGGLMFTGYSLHSEARTRRIANLLKLTEGHRDLWREHFQNPRLIRVLDPQADLAAQPVTREEEIFVNLVIQHLSVVYHAMRDDLTIKPEGLRRDLWWFFSLPVPAAVWQKSKILQNERFAAFVEACRTWK